jgi:hypothetical protein
MQLGAGSVQYWTNIQSSAPARAKRIPASEGTPSWTLEVYVSNALRQHYRPKVRRVPEWMRWVWLWF